MPTPYTHALDGLDLPDPVAAFFDFCREREAVRMRREAGAAPPWSDDPVFQKGRFLNVFREDDRGTKAVLRFAEGADSLPELVHALFFARWCNRGSTLDQLDVADLRDPDALQARLLALPDQPWTNVTAYPVEALNIDGVLHSRLECATHLFARIAPELTELILSADRDVVRATAAVNAKLGMANDFPIFMAIVDLALFRPDVIDPASRVPTGIGAAPYLDRLEEHLGLHDHEAVVERMMALQGEHWPDAKRALLPIDVEYLSCECRKYYSYVNGTKSFTGKNVFNPGQDPRMLVDVADAGPEVQTRIHVLAGGPCSGKSTLAEALREAGHRVEPETSETLLLAGLAEGSTAAELRADPVAWQTAILHADHALFDGLPPDELVFTDTSFVEDLPYTERAGIEVGPNLLSWLRRRRYARVFFLEPVTDYEATDVRMESAELARRLSEAVRQAYVDLGYEVVDVPAGSVDERLGFVRERIAR